MRHLGEFLLFLGLLAGVWWALRTSEPLGARWAAENDTVLRRIFNLPPDVSLEFTQTRPGEDPDTTLVTFEIARGDERRTFELPVSRDGRRVRYDGRQLLLADPFSAVRSEISLDNLPAHGAENAALTIVEFSDFTCQYCRQFFNTTEPELLARYGRRVRLLYKYAPVGEARPGSEEAALAAACAFRQSNQAFWAYHARLFSQASRLAEGRSVLLALAREAELELPAFERCLNERQSLPDVSRDIEEADRLGVDATPTFFFNGRAYYGLPPREYFFQIVEEELKAAR
ncbi:MAG: DsbA family protein [Candidatus Acidiferrales bacterium]